MPDSIAKQTLGALKAQLATSLSRPVAGLAPHRLSIRHTSGTPLKLALGCVHEVLPARHGHGAAFGFLIHCLAAHQASHNRPVLWVSDWRSRAENGRLYAPGLAQAGLDPGRVICVSVRREKDVLWVLEQALGSGALAAVGGAFTDLALTPSRRLALAARRTNTPLFLLRPAAATGATVAETRWQVTSLPSTPDPFDPRAPGHAAWRLDLIRNRSGPPATWEVTCTGDDDDTEDALNLVAAPGHRAVVTRPSGRQPRHARG